MKTILKFITLLLLGNAASRSETFHFPIGEVPPVSLVEAAGICGKMAASLRIAPFNPITATLTGGKAPKSGAWVFEQLNKDGMRYRFAVYFPEDRCVVFLAKGDKIIGMFKRNGDQLPIPLERGPGESGPDPFAADTPDPTRQPAPPNLPR